MLLTRLVAAILFSASLVVCKAKRARVSASRSHSSQSQGQDINWSQFFIYAINHPQDASLPETMKNHDVASLCSHLIKHPENQYMYNELCKNLDGNLFKSVFSFVLQDEDLIGSRQSVLMPITCLWNIPDHSWSMITKRFAQLTDIGLDMMPSKSIAQLSPKVLEIMVRKFHTRQKLLSLNYSDWSIHLKTAHFDPDNWTGGLWHVLTAESIGAMKNSKVQKAAISIVAGDGMRIPDGGYGIRESEIIDHGLRLTRLKSIQKHFQRIQGVKGMVEYIEGRVAWLEADASDLLARNYIMTEKKSPSIKIKRRIDLLLLIKMFLNVGSSSKTALGIVKDFMESFGKDKKAAVTWEIFSKFIGKNTDVGIVNLIGATINEVGAETLPIDSLITEACLTKSIKVLLTIIDSCHSPEMINRIVTIVDVHRRSLGHQYGTIMQAIEDKA